MTNISIKSIFFLILTLQTNLIAQVTNTINPKQVMREKNGNFFKIKEELDGYFKKLPEKKKVAGEEYQEDQSGYHFYNRWEWFWMNRVYKGNSDPGSFNYYRDALSEYASSSVFKTLRGKGGTNSNSSKLLNTPICTVPGSYPSTWAEIGPTSMPCQNLGFMVSVAVDPNDNNVIYAGGLNSGLWKTNNGGSTWHNVTDVTRLPGLGVPHILIDPNNSQNIYIATALDPTVWDWRESYGVGVLKSTDGGANWFSTALTFDPSVERRYIAKLIMDPTNSDILYAISNDKIFKTTDGGLTWPALSSAPVLPNTCWQNMKFTDMEMDPSDNNRIFVAATDYQACTGGGQLFMTTDGGGSWSSDFAPVSGIERISIDVTAANSSFLYITYNLWGGSSYFSKYNISSSSWSTPNTINAGINLYHHQFEISPTDDQVMYVGNQYMYKSTNGGLNFTLVSSYNSCSLHADKRAIQILSGSLPGAGGNTDVLYIATDGGISTSNNGASTYTNINGTGLGTVQFFGLSNSEAIPQVFGAGAQDNGAYVYNASTNSWVYNLVGDAYECVHDNYNSQYMYMFSNGGSLAIKRSSNMGTSWGSMNQPETNGLNYRPMLMHPYNNSLYVGYHNLWKCSDPRVTGNVAWTQLSDFSALGTSGTDKIIAFDVFPSNTNYMLAAMIGPTFGTVEHKLYKTTSGGGTGPTAWTDISTNIPALAYASITDVVYHPTDANIFWITLNAFWTDGNGNAVNKVLKTTDGGTTWSDYSTGLPDFPVNCIVYEKGSNGGLYVGNDVGVFYRNNNMPNWECFSYNLPVCIVSDLEINYATNKLRAATYGRGIWSSNLACPTDYNLSLTGTVNQSAFSEAQNNILSSQIINTTSQVTYRGGNQIELLNGFSSGNGNFVAYIHPCDHPGNSFRLLNNFGISDLEAQTNYNSFYEATNKKNIVQITSHVNGVFDLTSLSNIESLALFDLSGRNVKTFRNISQTFLTLDLTDLNNGIYLLEVIGSDFSQKQKISIRK